jgi:hypothetical protein
MENQTEQLSFGEKLVGITFNPSNDSDVQKVKSMCAELANIVASHRQPESNEPYLANTIKGEAIRTILDAQMWIVKYITLKY